MSARTMANRYPGKCDWCGQPVAAGEGVATGRPAGRGRYSKPRMVWTVSHRPTVWAGSPTGGRWVGGCPSEADR